MFDKFVEDVIKMLCLNECIIFVDIFIGGENDKVFFDIIVDEKEFSFEESL